MLTPARAAAAGRERPGHRAVAVGVGEEPGPGGMLEDRGVTAALDELEPSPIVHTEQAHRDRASDGETTAGETLASVRRRRTHARWRADGSSTIAGRGSSRASTAY